VGKQRHRRKIESLESRIREHQEKISRENQKAVQDPELVPPLGAGDSGLPAGHSSGAETPEEIEMRVTRGASKASYLSARIEVLLLELEEECQGTLELLAQLETPGLGEEQVERILGELSAAIVHLHEHTRGLDRTIDLARVKS
jgi:hypothetical protein